MTITINQTILPIQLLTSSIDHTLRTAGNISSTLPSRICKLTWKATKHPVTKNTIPALSPNLFVEVPIITDLVISPSLLQETLLNSYEELQNSAIRAFVENQLLAKKTITSGLEGISTTLLTPTAIISFLAETKEKTGHLNKEIITTFFNTLIKEELELKIVSTASLKNLPMTDTQLSTQISTYLDNFTALSAPTTIFSPEAAKQLLRVFQLSTSTEVPILLSTAEKIEKKLNNFINPVLRKTEVLFDIGD